MAGRTLYGAWLAGLCGVAALAVPASAGAISSAQCAARVNDTPSKLVECIQKADLSAHMDNLQAIANDDASLGELRLGASTSSLTGVVAPLLRSLYARHPKLAVYIEPGNSQALYQRVTSGMLDAAVIVEPQFTLPKSCGWQVLVEEPLCVLAQASLAGRDPLELLASGRHDVWDALTKRFESKLILTALANTRGRRIEAAQKLGIGRNTITRKIQELGLE